MLPVITPGPGGDACIGRYNQTRRRSGSGEGGREDRQRRVGRPVPARDGQDHRRPSGGDVHRGPPARDHDRGGVREGAGRPADVAATDHVARGRGRVGDRLATLSVETAADVGSIGRRLRQGADRTSNLHSCATPAELGRAVGCPVVVGPSRKRFLKTLVGMDPTRHARCRLGALRVWPPCAGAAQVLRIHNVALLRTALAVSPQV